MAGKKQPAPAKKPPSNKGGASKTTSTRKPRPGAPQNPPTPTTTTPLESPPSPSPPPTTESAAAELRRQQTLLDVFGRAFRDVLGAADLGARVQEVKAALFRRDFGAAFAREAALDVYAARWSPTRALCYGRVLRGLDPHLEGLFLFSSPLPPSSSTESSGGSTARRDEEGVGAREEEGEEVEREAGDSPVRGAKLDDGAPGDETRDLGPGEPEALKPSVRQGVSDSGREDDIGQGAQVEVEIREGEGERERQILTLRILAIGGAAAEIVAFADYISSRGDNGGGGTTRAEITLLDVGPWGPAVQKLRSALTSAPPLSRYAGAAAREANRALVAAGSLGVDFVQRDALSLTREELGSLLVADRRRRRGRGEGEAGDQTERGPVLITLLFTLNELYTTAGTGRATAFLRLLSALVAPGTLLLVVDSPGSYAEAAVGREARRYPMQWLLDHTLVPPPPRERRGPGVTREEGAAAAAAAPGGEAGGLGRWERVESHDSVWFRVADGLRYPIPLENMRYQMHLYRAVSDPPSPLDA